MMYCTECVVHYLERGKSIYKKIDRKFFAFFSMQEYLYFDGKKCEVWNVHVRTFTCLHMSSYAVVPYVYVVVLLKDSFIFVFLKKFCHFGSTCTCK